MSAHPVFAAILDDFAAIPQRVERATVPTFAQHLLYAAPDGYVYCGVHAAAAGVRPDASAFARNGSHGWGCHECKARAAIARAKGAT